MSRDLLKKISDSFKEAWLTSLLRITEELTSGAIQSVRDRQNRQLHLLEKTQGTPQ